MQIFTIIGRFLSGLSRYGILGLAAGAFFESFGIPTAAAVIDLTAGLLILSGKATFLEVLIACDIGLVAGSLVAYHIGKAGAKTLERWHRHPRDENAKRTWAHHLIDRYGNKAVLFAQLFGPARTWISYPAGAMRMDLKQFTIYTAIGGGIYLAAIITLSLYLTDIIKRRFEEILRWVATPPVIIGTILGIALIYFVRRWWIARLIQARELDAIETKNHTDAD